MRLSRSRLTTSETNALKPDPISFDTEMAASNSYIPPIYGENIVPGRISAWGADGTNLVFRVVWGCGEVHQIEECWVDDAALGATVKVNHYRGTTIQGVDPYVAAIDSITGYADTMRLLKPAGIMGIAYSVFSFPTGTLTTAPRFKARIKGALVYYPQYVNYTDPLLLQTVFACHFEGTNGAGTGVYDIGLNGLTQTFANGASIQSNQLSLDGSNDFAYIADSADTRFDANPWSLEIKCTPSSVGSVNDNLVSKGIATATNYGFRLFRFEDDLRMEASSNGTSNNIVGGLIKAACFSAGVEIEICLEFTGREYTVKLDGVEVYRLSSVLTIHPNTVRWEIGAYNSAGTWAGTIRSVRFTKGAVRYGGEYTSAAVVPFADSESRAGYIYSDNTVLCLNELISNPFYGLGSTSENLLNAQAWADETVGGSPRCRLSLVLDSQKPTTQWIDLLAEYASVFVYYNADSVYLLPDCNVSATNPSGWAMGDNPKFAVDVATNTSWTYGAHWTWYDVADQFPIMIKAAGTGADSVLEQTQDKAFEAGVEYVCTLAVALIYGGSMSLLLNGFPVIDAITTADIHTFEFIATGYEEGQLLEVTTEAATVAWISEASVRRKYWVDNTLVEKSFSFDGLSDIDTPTQVLLSYTEKTATANFLERVYQDAKLPGVDEGEVPLVETTLSMPGIYNASEAQYKALAKLYRMGNKARYSWTSTDIGIAIQRGKVVQVVDSSASIDVYVVVEDVEMISPGRYKVSAISYAPSNYPSEIIPEPSDYGVVPVGAITLLSGDTLPADWDLWTDADGYYLIGADDVTYSVADTGGSTTHAGLTTHDLSDAGTAHGPGIEKMWSRGFESFISSGSGPYYNATEDVAGAHDHTVTTGTLTPQFRHRKNKLIIKVTSTGAEIPVGASFFGLGSIVQENMARVLSFAGRPLMADDVNSNSNTTTPSVTVNSSYTDDSHDHHNDFPVINGYPTGTNFGPVPQYEPATGGGSHRHQVYVGIEVQLLRRKLPLWSGTVGLKVIQGVIFGWSGSLSSLPTDYTLCNGRLGTVDMAAYFVEIALAGEEELSAGNNTLRLSGSTDYVAHNHKGAENGSYTDSYTAVSHGADFEHSHALDATEVSWMPPYYALAFIMYNPVPVVGFVDVSLLVTGDGTSGSTTILDASQNALTAAYSGSGTIAYSSLVTLFGLNTILAPGSTRRIEYAAFPYGQSFTIEGFFRNTASSEMVLIGNRIVADANTFQVRKDASGDINLYTGDTIRATVALGLTTNDWFYVGVVYDFAAGWRLYAGLQSGGTAVVDTYSDAGRTISADLHVLGGTGADSLAGNAGQIRAHENAVTLSGSIVAIPAGPFATS